MISKIVSFLLLSLCSLTWSTTAVKFHQAPISQLYPFNIAAKVKQSVSSPATHLEKISNTKLNGFTITRYQQMHQSIPIIGAQVTVSQNPAVHGLAKSKVNGLLFDEVNVNTKPSISANEATQLAKNYYKVQDSKDEKSQLQFRINKDKQLQLTYLISFKSLVNNQLSWPFIVIDAHTGEILKTWDNIQHFSDAGPGGNEKLQEYWYGKDNLPGLNVTQLGQTCSLDDGKVALVNLNFAWDWEGKILTTFKYPCGNNVEDLVHGAYSAGNDAYYFGHVIVDLFKDWYGLPALQDKAGNPIKLIMRVHFGSAYDNAFWNGKVMSFGDGDMFYPLVSLDIAGHEVAHGFTEQHSSLEYHDESGALNESFSDMAGIATRAYLLEKNLNLYNKTHLTPNKLTWTIGETIIPATIPMKALRFMDIPSLDGDSADCVDKRMARAEKSLCAISYPELLAYAEHQYPTDELKKQSYIVHTASGVFNRAFYLMAQELGVKKAFEVMIVANAKYWTPTSDFNEGACGVIAAAQESGVNFELIQNVFKKVGIATNQCLPN